MDSEIGNLRVRIDADTSGLERGTQQGQRSLKQFDSSMERTTAIARHLTGVLGAIGIGVSFAQAIREVSNFQAAMNGLAAVSGATADQMASLEQQARSLGATSQFSAQQAGEAQRFLAQAGFEVNEILGATPGILQLATAGSLDLASAADIASNVLGGMRMEVDELNRVNDVLAATAARSNTSIEQLGQALSYAAPFAAGAGIEIEDLAAAIGVMSDAGIQASRAGTGLVGVIRQLSRVTDTGQAVLERYGLSMADVSIEARGLGPVLETLREANLDTAAAIELFGSEAGAAAQVLVSDYKGAIQDATGEAERMAKQLDQGLGPAFKSLQSAISESVLQMGDSGLAGALENLIRTTTGVISVFNGMGDEWADANDASQKLRITVDGLAIAMQTMAAIAAGRALQALGAYTAAKIAANGATLTLTGSIAALRTAMMGLMGPAGIILGGVTALGALGRALDDTSQRMARMEGRANELAASLQHMGETSIRTQLAAVTLELANMEGAQQALEEQSRRSSRTNSVLGADFRNLSDSIQTTVVAARHSREEHEKLRTQQLALKNALDLVADSGRAAGEAVSEIALPGLGQEEGDDSAEQRRADELERLREHLARRLEVIRESLMNEQELEVEHHAKRMEELAEIRDHEIVTDEEYRKLKEEAELQHLERLRNMEQRAADERIRLQEEEARARQAVQQGMMNNLVSLMNSGSKEMFRIGKIAAVAQALLAGREAIVSSYAAGARIGGPPLGAAFAATAAAATAAQIASVKSTTFGGGAVTGGSTGGGGTSAISQGPQQPGPQQQPIGGTLTVEGISSSALFSGDAVRELAEELIEFQRRGGQVVLA